MNVKELRERIILSLEAAQKHSKPPRTTEGRYAMEDRIIAERDRLSYFVAGLSGAVQKSDPQLGAALMAFLHAEPGAPLPGQAAPAPAADTSAPAGAA